MLYAHNIHINVFSKPEDDFERTKQALISLIPFDIVKEKIEFKTESAEINDERKMKILEIILKKQKHTNDFIKHIFSNIGKDAVETLKSQIETRVDENASFFLRLDKYELMINGKYILTDSGNCFHIKMSIAAYPSNKEKAVIIANQMIDDYLSNK